jgi:hypothetical protein
VHCLGSDDQRIKQTMSWSSKASGQALFLSTPYASTLADAAVLSLLAGTDM